MPIHFSDHAKEQLKKRHIDEELVRDVVQNPDKILTSYRQRKLRRKKLGDTIVEVVTKTEGSKITVVTAYVLEE